MQATNSWKLVPSGVGARAGDHSERTTGMQDGQDDLLNNVFCADAAAGQVPHPGRLRADLQQPEQGVGDVDAAPRDILQELQQSIHEQRAWALPRGLDAGPGRC